MAKQESTRIEAVHAAAQAAGAALEALENPPERRYNHPTEGEKTPYSATQSAVFSAILWFWRAGGADHERTP